MDCDCDMPDCMECFERYAQGVVDAGCADKELYYEWQDVQGILAADYHSDKDIPDEIYELGDSWE